jgi:hypothetical protein
VYPGGFYGADYGILPEAAGPDVYILTTELPEATSGVPYLETIVASGGEAPYVFSLFSGTLPPGLALSADGVIAGTPLAAPPAIVPTILPPGRVDHRYTHRMTITAGVFVFTVRVTDAEGFADAQTYDVGVESWVEPVVFDKEAVLPRCLRVLLDGWVAGTPMRVGTFTFTLRAFDAAGQVITTTHTLTVTP